MSPMDYFFEKILSQARGSPRIVDLHLAALKFKYDVPGLSCSAEDHRNVYSINVFSNHPLSTWITLNASSFFLHHFDDEAQGDTSFTDVSDTAEVRQTHILFAIILTSAVDCFPFNHTFFWREYKGLYK